MFMNDIWTEASETFGSVFIKTPFDESYIYKGIKITKYTTNDSSDIYTIYRTNTGFYAPLEGRLLDNFLSRGFVYGVDQFNKKKYLQCIDEINLKISNEMSSGKNYKKIKRLKKIRDKYLSKINKIENGE